MYFVIKLAKLEALTSAYKQVSMTKILENSEVASTDFSQ